MYVNTCIVAFLFFVNSCYGLDASYFLERCTHVCQNQKGLNVSQQTRPKSVISQLFNKYVHISCFVPLGLHLHIRTKMWPHKKFVCAHPFEGHVCMWGDRHVYLVTIETKLVVYTANLFCMHLVFCDVIRTIYYLW